MSLRVLFFGTPEFAVPTLNAVARSPHELVGAVTVPDKPQGRIGLFQGRMEFGPRALGGRSIIGDARSTNMQSIINLKIKFN